MYMNFTICPKMSILDFVAGPYAGIAVVKNSFLLLGGQKAEN